MFHGRGARHGLTASGKLARIAQQEAELMAKMTLSKFDSQQVMKKENTEKKERKKRNKLADSEIKVEVKPAEETIGVACLEDVSPNDNQSTIKKKKKRSRKVCEDSLVVHSENIDSTVALADETLRNSADICDVTELVTSEKRKKKKKKDKEKSCELPNLLKEEPEVDQSCEEPKKKKTKKKKHNSLDS